MATNTFPNWTDLKDNVPVLTGTDNFERWDKAVHLYCIGEGIAAHITDFNLDPFWIAYGPVREPDVFPEGYIAGTQAPTGTDIVEDVREELIQAEQVAQGLPPLDAAALAIAMEDADEDLQLTDVQMIRWNRWARSERLARIVLLMTMEADISVDYEDYPTVRHIYSAVLSRFRLHNPEKIALAKRELYSLFLPRGANAKASELFYQKYVRIYAQFARLDDKVDDADKVLIFLSALPSEYAILLRTQWASITPQSWSRFTAVYSTFVEGLRVNEERERIYRRQSRRQ